MVWVGVKTDLLTKNILYWNRKGGKINKLFGLWDTLFYMLLLPVHYLLSYVTIRFDSDRLYFIHALFIRLVRLFIILLHISLVVYGIMYVKEMIEIRGL